MDYCYVKIRKNILKIRDVLLKVQQNRYGCIVVLCMEASGIDNKRSRYNFYEKYPTESIGAIINKCLTYELNWALAALNLIRQVIFCNTM